MGPTEKNKMANNATTMTPTRFVYLSNYEEIRNVCKNLFVKMELMMKMSLTALYKQCIQIAHRDEYTYRRSKVI